MKTTVGQLLINHHLPEGMKDYTRRLDKGGTKALFTELAEKYPDRYKEIAQRLSEVGSDVSHNEGSSISLDDLATSEAKNLVIPALRAEVQAIAEDDSLTRQQKDERIVQATAKLLGKLDEAVFLEGKRKGNRLVEWAVSGARGNKSQINQMQGAPLIVTDHKNRPIPVPLLSSFSEGLDPVEMWATSYGVRKGYVDLKQATPKAGFFSKQLANAAHRLIVKKDRPLPGTGLPVETDDPDNEGAILARKYGNYDEGTILTPSIMKQLKAKYPNILVHSPIAAPVAGGGIPQWAAGVRDKGLATPGENIGIPAAQAISEPLAQSAISCLAEGTLVRMADLTVKHIEEVQVGDKVLGSDLDGRLTPTTVTRVYDQGIQPCSEYTFRRGCCRRSTPSAFETLISTSEHKVLGVQRYTGSGGSVKRTRVLKVGDLNKKSGLALSSGFDENSEVSFAVLDNTDAIGPVHVYDIEVEHPDHLFLLANGMIVSNSKHTAGVVGASGGGSSAESRQGFEAVNRMANIPKHYEGKAPVTEVDGKVSKIEKAPQGGHYVYVGDARYYVDTGQVPTIKVGQYVEAGDVLSSGLPSPADVVRYKGIGEGRRYFTNLMRETLKSSGVQAHRRNIELMSRALLNHIRITGDGGPKGSMMDDIVEYDDYAARYTPRQGARESKVKLAKGKYLEQPILHYSIGTRITPRVMKELAQYDVSDVLVHDNEPEFVPEMQRAMDVMSQDPDWMSRMGGFYLQKNILDAVHRGSSSQLTGSTSYIPALARGVEFGRGKESPY